MKKIMLMFILTTMVVSLSGCIYIVRTSPRIAEVGEIDFYADFTQPKNQRIYATDTAYYLEARVIGCWKRAFLLGAIGAWWPYTFLEDTYTFIDSSSEFEHYVWVEVQKKKFPKGDVNFFHDSFEEFSVKALEDSPRFPLKACTESLDKLNCPTHDEIFHDFNDSQLRISFIKVSPHLSKQTSDYANLYLGLAILDGIVVDFPASVTFTLLSPLIIPMRFGYFYLTDE